MERIPFNVFDLSHFEAASEPLSEAGPELKGYTSFEKLLESLRNLPERPKRVSPKALSVNGQVVHDAMDRYLLAPGESSSLLKKAIQSPRHYYYEKTAPLPKKESPHFTFGTFCHSAFLEPDLFEKVKVMPDASLSTLKGCRSRLLYLCDALGVCADVDLNDWPIDRVRAQIKERMMQAEEAGFTFVSETDAKIIDFIRSGFNSYGGGILPKLMRYTQTETSMYGTDEETGLKVKIRPDGMLLAENFGIDAILSVKTTSAVSLRQFYSDCAKFKYDLAEGMYLEVASAITGRPFTATLMLMIQSVSPYGVAFLFWDPNDLEVGKKKYREAMETVKRCRDANRWPGFDSEAEEGAFGIIRAKLPDYIKNF